MSTDPSHPEIHDASQGPLELRVIGILRTCYAEKFGVPRQSGLVPSAWGEIHLRPEFARDEAFRGIEGFSHLWLITLFHEVKPEQIGLTVRPPRLGGNERLGVFATRSPFRPNRLALSVVKFEALEQTSQGLILKVSGVDAVDGTPVLDIKPYVPYADSIPGAVGGFATEAPERHPVRWLCSAPEGPASTIIADSLTIQPSPAYQHDPDRIYRACIAGHEIAWRQTDASVELVSCEPQARFS